MESSYVSSTHQNVRRHEHGPNPSIRVRHSDSDVSEIKAIMSSKWLHATATPGVPRIEHWSARSRYQIFDEKQSRRMTRFCRSVIKSSASLLFLFLVFSVWNCLANQSYADAPERYQSLEKLVKSSTTPGRGNLNHEKVFIAANIVDERLIRGAWGESLVSLVNLLGKDNVFVSIYENDGGNSTSQALRQLQQRLKCNSSVVTGDHIHLSHFPQIRLPSGEERVQRLAYLAEIRNRLLRPLDPVYQDNHTVGFRKASDIKFDKVLFLNDIYYSPLEAVQLLFSTNAVSGLAQYRAACAIDFVQLFKLYDTFVVRDADGYGVALQYFPWFTQRGSGTSRSDVLSFTDAVRVRSCWGGMVAFDASIFQPHLKTYQSSPTKTEQQPLLKFRSNGEPFWEAAECCLIFADMETMLDKDSSRYDKSGIFINPYVRTAYSLWTWKWLPFFKSYERFFQYYQYVVDVLKPPEWNPRRTHQPGQMVDEVVWTDSTARRVDPNPHYRKVPHGHFEVQRRPATAGGFCGQRRMFIMKQDLENANQGGIGKNWESIRVPWHFEP